MKLYLFLILLTAYAIPGFCHPFHVSVSELIYNDKNESLEVMHKFFADDLELALQKRYGTMDDFIKSPEKYKDEIEAYLKENFSLKVNGKHQDLRYLGAEPDGDAIWCYMEVPQIKEIKKVEITSSLLMEVFNDQTQLVHIQYGSKKESIRLSDRHRSDMVVF